MIQVTVHGRVKDLNITKMLYIGKYLAEKWIVSSVPPLPSRGNLLLIDLLGSCMLLEYFITMAQNSCIFLLQPKCITGDRKLIWAW